MAHGIEAVRSCSPTGSDVVQTSRVVLLEMRATGNDFLDNCLREGAGKVLGRCNSVVTVLHSIIWILSVPQFRDVAGKMETEP
jgi:hypothetical protein